KELTVAEVNSGVYVFQCEKLFNALRQIAPNNAQGEYYLTDVFEVFSNNGWRVSAVKAIDSTEVMGINNPAQLEEARKALASRPSS
ncbi:MAG TPA: bifunctional UDP-N-acetylglucosamine diphosphorylase/glucosamine-1-phosphate N-acetyltransferase GlmU, partial [Bacteroidota bacterium]|nr:bifunctional UDP-N-acetylglucosamine diphosphorylase/glucosamine-1-phosphate N-acetyltransferase GlmU [Bacteroidota bacterium]